MQWITRHIYVDLETGEIVKGANKEEIVIIKTTKKITHEQSKRITTYTNFYRKSKYKQQELGLTIPASREGEIRRNRIPHSGK